MSDAIARLRKLPSVDQLLQTEAGAAAVDRFGRPGATAAIRSVLAEARLAVREGQMLPKTDALAVAALELLEIGERSPLRQVFNLTGTVLHTNLGRAVLAEAAIEAATAAMQAAVALEYDLDTGKRGERDDHLRGLLCELTGAEDATVVNNNAAAVLLVLNSLAAGKEAIVSRGELIEIGGAFRMPDIMAGAGARLIEVGTTNRTHLKDYVGAIGPQTGVVLKVHPSNYRIEGFVAEVSARELAEVCRVTGAPLVNDLGSGTLIDLRRFGLAHEPTVWEAVADGADLITFSGDKLLGGPQAGFIVGRKNLIKTINQNPMKRALRVDKIRLAALEATLKLYRDPDRLAERLPTLRHLARPLEEIAAMAQRLAPAVQKALGEGLMTSCAECASQIGSGALPLSSLPSAGLALAPKKGGGRALDQLTAAFRRLPIPVIGRIENGALLLDLRCLEDEAGFAANLASIDPALGAGGFDEMA
ncbi:L-seryl-tRNA(Sec) selenium transferase [Methylocapsa aurea]|uniref:L-seryl-tRNA(Sec) selenium transferase n=1 Tax=Methylocapsa aurea TaxID=663610 RepID=UPI000560DE63|nr:L-seryl-tRNA(Sec) selenium transferase [Methylocapsa aurea]